MCFSAEASFGASALMGVIGVVSLRKINRKKQLLFASIPLFFAVQQFSEGLVWLSLMHSKWANFGQFSAYIFLVFAFLIWPVWMPLSVWLLEKQGAVKKLLLVAVVFGGLFAIIFSFYLFNHSVFPEVRGHHIHYALGFSGNLMKSASLLYFIPTIIPPLISHWKSVRILGVFLLISYLLSKFYFAEAVVSVWCFLGAFISFIVLLALKEMRENENPKG